MTLRLPGLFSRLCAVMCGVSFLLAGTAGADSNSAYKAGSDFAHQVQGQGAASLQNFRSQKTLPGYTDRPALAPYYDGAGWRRKPEKRWFHLVIDQRDRQYGDGLCY